MADPISSPDGKFIWTGSEWIPAPPSSASDTVSSSDSTINIEDSMMSGKKNIEQNSNDASSEINLKDSAMIGDINLIQNDAEEIAKAMVQALERMGFSRQSTPAESTTTQEQEVVHGLAQLTPTQEQEFIQCIAESTPLEEQEAKQLMVDVRALADQEDELIQWENLSEWNRKFTLKIQNSLKQYHLRSLKKNKKKKYRKGEAISLNALSEIEILLGNLHQAERMCLESQSILKQVGDRLGEATSLNTLGKIARIRGDLDEANRLYGESLVICREDGFKIAEATSLIGLGIIASENSNIEEASIFFKEAVRIQRKHGVPVHDWFINNGF